MDKKNGRTANGTTKLERDKHTTQPTRCATKHELVALHLLEQGAQGVSALSALAGLHDLNPRNSISELRRQHGVRISDEYFSHQHSGGGFARIKRYWLADRAEARKAAELVNLKRKHRGAAPLSREQIARYLAAFPIQSGHKPAA